MTPREKIDAAVAYLKTRKIAASTAAPPLYRLFWSMGLYLPPPHFQSFLATAHHGNPVQAGDGRTLRVHGAGSDLMLVGAGTACSRACCSA